MTKINQIITYLENEKKDVAVISDPVTIQYLTGFYSDVISLFLFQDDFAYSLYFVF